MRNFLVVVLFLAVVAGAIGLWRGWFSLSKDGKVDVQGNPTKFQEDRKAFSKSVSEKATAVKHQVQSLWEKSDKLSVADKKELDDLKVKHERLEQQIKTLNDAGEDKFDSIKQDLTKDLDDVEKRIEELTKKVEKASAKKDPS